MIDYTLRFESEEQALSVTEGFETAANHRYDVDIIGMVEGGFYVNLRLLADDASLPEALEPFVVTLESPIRVWA